MLRNRVQMGSWGDGHFKVAKPQKSTTVRHFCRFFAFLGSCFLARNWPRERSRERCENRFVFVSILVSFWRPLWGPWGAWKNSKADVGAPWIEKKRNFDFSKGVLGVTFWEVFLDIGPGSIFDRFLLDFGPILDRFLSVFFTYFCLFFVCFLKSLWIDF